MGTFNASIKQLYDKDNSQFTYYTATERITIYAGQNGVTEEWIKRIKALHRIERNYSRRDEKAVDLDAITDLVGDKSELLDIGAKSPEMELIEKQSKDELHRQLSIALGSLNDKQRALLFEVRIEKHSISSIARREGLHESSVRERLARIEKRLRKLLTEAGLNE